MNERPQNTSSVLLSSSTHDPACLYMNNDSERPVMCSHVDLFNAMWNWAAPKGLRIWISSTLAARSRHPVPFQTPSSLWTSLPWPISKHDYSMCLTKWVEVQVVCLRLEYFIFISTIILKNFNLVDLLICTRKYCSLKSLSCTNEDGHRN